MTTVKDDSTAAADEQLGSLSLGESAERKDNETEPKAKNGTTPTKLLCSACVLWYVLNGGRSLM